MLSARSTLIGAVTAKEYLAGHAPSVRPSDDAEQELLIVSALPMLCSKAVPLHNCCRPWLPVAYSAHVGDTPAGASTRIQYILRHHPASGVSNSELSSIRHMRNATFTARPCQ